MLSRKGLAKRGIRCTYVGIVGGSSVRLLILLCFAGVSVGKRLFGLVDC
ncbi:MAG: hypothetical protein A4E28_02681 [Methanocella sp. PtaU1.Bin125]|nr:MAG: hypothetical protein A4E28_02681 [Methanocella sp. PtaU1.Bin125]